MESINIKTKAISDEINCICDEHKISEELVLKCAELIKKRQDLEYQAKNEVWYKKKPEDVYFSKEDLKEYTLPDTVKVAIHYRPNRDKCLFDEIEKVFNIDVCDIYDYSYTEEVDKEYEEMCQKYNPQDPKFIIWCLKREYPDKHIEYHQYNGLCQGDVYDCFFMCDKDVDINKEVALVKNYCQCDFDQYVREPDEILDYSDHITIFESELPSNDLSNEDEVKTHLKEFSGTDRNIVIKY